jgi:hypothetical protein
MRRPIRPFVTEYKSRSPKPAPREAEAADLEPRPRFLETPAAPTSRPRDDAHDDGYEAAMRAADLIFGKKLSPQPAVPVRTAERHHSALAEAEALFAPPAAPEPEPAIAEPPLPSPVAAPAPPAPPSGRILPSLIEAEIAPRREEEERPVRKRGRPRKTPLEPQKPATPAAEPTEEFAEPAEPVRRAPKPVARRPAERPAAAVAPEPSLPLDDEEEDEPAAERRARRPIQARWVRRTELAAGEKWKRRLPDSLRSR